MVWLLEFRSRLKKLSIKSINVKNLVNIDKFDFVDWQLSTNFEYYCLIDYVFNDRLWWTCYVLDKGISGGLWKKKKFGDSTKSSEILLFPQPRLNKYFSIRGISCYQLALFLVLLLKPLMILSMRPAGMRTSLGRNLQQLSGRFSWIS